MNQVLTGHVLSVSDEEVVCFSIKFCSAHAIDDELEIAVLAADNGIEGSLVLFVQVVDENHPELVAYLCHLLLLRLAEGAPGDQ